MREEEEQEEEEEEESGEEEEAAVPESSLVSCPQGTFPLHSLLVDASTGVRGPPHYIVVWRASSSVL